MKETNLIDLKFLNKVYDCLGSMINYADDGMLDRNDPMYSEFFHDIDMANKTLDELCWVIKQLREEEEENK